MTRVMLIQGLNVNYKALLLFIVALSPLMLPSCMKAPIGKSYKTKYVSEFYTVRNSSMYHISEVQFTGPDKKTSFEFDVTFENYESKYDSIRFTFSMFNEFPIKTLDKLIIEIGGQTIIITDFDSYYLEPKTKGWESRFNSFINFSQFKQLYSKDVSPVFTITYNKAGVDIINTFDKCKEWDKCAEAVESQIFILTDLD